MSAAVRRTTASGWRFIRHLENDVTSVLISLSHKACLSSPSIYLRSRLFLQLEPQEAKGKSYFSDQTAQRKLVKSCRHSVFKVSHLLLQNLSQDASFQAVKHKPSNGSQYHASSGFDINIGLIKSTSCVVSDGNGLVMSSPLLLCLTSVNFDGVFFWISLISDIAAPPHFRLYFKPIF